jgi:hypothetical protein
VTIALYATIWIALVLFCLGESGRRDFDDGRAWAPWTWWAFAAGCLLSVAHLAIAMGSVHGWNHQAAMDATARQTFAIYGLDWGGGVYVNYAFVALWVFEAWRWRTGRSGSQPRSRLAVWAVRIFFFVIILNAAVVFAVGPRRLAGAAIVLWLLWVWRPGRALLFPR